MYRFTFCKINQVVVKLLTKDTRTFCVTELQVCIALKQQMVKKCEHIV